MERWTPGGNATWDASFPMVPLGELLRTRRQQVSCREFTQFQPITIHFDGSVVPRNRAEPFQGAMFAAYSGDLIYSKIDVRNGAIGLVPENIPRVVVTSEYPVSVPDAKQVDARYLALLLRLPSFLRLLRAAASGTSGRKRVHGESFAQLEIPLPELTDQRRLLVDYEMAQIRAAKLGAEAEQIEQHAIREFEAALGLVPPPDLPKKPAQIAWFSRIERWSHEGIFDRSSLAASGKPVERYSLVALGDVVADLENGWSPQCLNRPATPEEWGVLKLGSVSFGVFNPQENKALPPRLRPIPGLEVQQGDVLISRANILKLVGACTFVHATRPHLMLCDKIFRAVLFRHSPILPEFLSEILRAPSVRQQIEAGATGTSPTMKNISKPALLNLTFPLPGGEEGVQVQTKLVSALRCSRARAIAKRTEASRLRSAAWYDFLTAIFR